MESEEQHIELAHKQRRRAEKLLKAQRFEDAIEAHKCAIERLQRVLSLAKNKSVRESVELQISFHNRQQLIVAYKQERQRSLLKRQPSMSYTSRTTAESDMPVTGEEKYLQIQETIDYNDSLLQFLLRKPGDGASKSPQVPPIKESTLSKTPKTETQVIEELRMNNCELKKLVESLLAENIQLAKSNTELRQELEVLKGGAPKSSPVEDDVSPDDGDVAMPDLAPLDRPDFGTFDIPFYSASSVIQEPSNQ